jgi:hypothetical protein
MTDEFHNTLISQIGGDIEEGEVDEILDESFDEDNEDGESFDEVLDETTDNDL